MSVKPVLVRQWVTKSTGLPDLAVPVRGGPVGDAARAVAEVAVEVGADLVAFQPGAPYLFQRHLDVVVGEVADSRGSHRVVGRPVEVFLRLGQAVQAGQEERHLGAVVGGEFTKAWEEAVPDLAGAVPGEDHELWRCLARFQPVRHRLARLWSGVRGGPVADRRPGGPGRGAGRWSRLGMRGVAPRAASGERAGRRGRRRAEQVSAGDRGHVVPDSRELACVRPATEARREQEFFAQCIDTYPHAGRCLPLIG